MNIEELLKDHQSGHSEFQVDYLITSRAGGNRYGQYKQALREINKRVRGFTQLHFSFRKSTIKLKRDKSRLDNTTDSYQKELLLLKIEERKFGLIEIERGLEDTHRELERFYCQALSLKNEIGELTDQRRRELDEEFWVLQIKQRAAVDYLVAGRLRDNTLEFLAAFPERLRKDLKTAVTENKADLIEWFFTQSVMPLPDIKRRKSISEAEILMLEENNHE